MVKQVEKVETAIEPRFQEHFVEAMALPHKTAPYRHLRRAVVLPQPKLAASSEAAEGGRRRRRGRGAVTAPGSEAAE